MSVEERLKSIVSPLVSSQDLSIFDRPSEWVSVGDDTGLLQRLGLILEGKPAQIFVREVHRPIGRVTIKVRSENCKVFVENRHWHGNLYCNAIFGASNGLIVLNLFGDAGISLENVLLRSSHQTLFWGVGSSALQCRIVEIEGEHRSIVVGDDALISEGVCIRNFDMHAVVDVANMLSLNQPVNTIIEQHVWLSQDALLIGATTIGFGSVVGARSLVRGAVPHLSIAAGAPARVIRTGRSWGRSATSISQREQHLIARLAALAAQTPAVISLGSADLDQP